MQSNGGGEVDGENGGKYQDEDVEFLYGISFTYFFCGIPFFKHIRFWK